MNKKIVTTRFSPSPTGLLHLGGCRTALYNYLVAKQNNGRFLLRIEDTDESRTVEGATDYILNSLAWLGIKHDGEILVQSKRLNIYKEYALKLINSGHAYYAFDTKDELAILRGTDENKPIAYGAYTRERMKNSLTLSKEEVDELLSNGTPYIIRFKTEKNREIVLNDTIRGRVSFNTNNVDDKVLIKENGGATYFIANTVDDALSGVTHVIKGSEWLSSCPTIIMLYEAFGWELPEFCHISLILGDDGKKLSKRHGDKYGYPVFPLSGNYIDKEKSVSVVGFKESGYLPEALLNAVLLIGWSPKDDSTDILSLENMIEQFDLKKVHVADAMFSISKLKFLNKEYLKKKDFDYLISFIEKGNTYVYDDARLKLIIDIALERSNFNYELNDSVNYFFGDVDYKNVKIKHSDEFMKFAKLFLQISVYHAFDSIDRVKENFDWTCEEVKIEKGKILPDLRNALCGGKSGAELTVTLWILGVSESKKRIEDYCDYLKAHL